MSTFFILPGGEPRHRMPGRGVHGYIERAAFTDAEEDDTLYYCPSRAFDSILPIGDAIEDEIFFEVHADLF